MKTKTSMYRLRAAAFICSTFFFFSSCNKNNDQLPNADSTNSVTASFSAPAVTSYMNRLIKANPASAEWLGKLKNSLDLDALHIETITGKVRAVLIPVAKSYGIQADKGKATTTLLMLRINSQQKVENTDIIQYTPDKAGEALPAGAVTEIYNRQGSQPAINGKIAYLSLQGTPLWGLVYKSGEVTATFKAKEKLAGSGSVGSAISSLTESCFEYYWVISYPDGTEEWEFLYATCSNPALLTVNPDANAGSPEEEQQSKSIEAIEDWHVAGKSTGTKVWEVRSVEKYTGISKQGDNPPHNGHFTGNDHSAFRVLGNSDATFTNATVASTFTTDNATTSVIGQVNYTEFDQQTYHVSAPYKLHIVGFGTALWL